MEVEFQVKSKFEISIKTEVETEVSPEVELEVEPKIKPEVNSEVEPEIEPEVKPEFESEVKLEVESVVKCKILSVPKDDATQSKRSIHIQNVHYSSTFLCNSSIAEQSDHSIFLNCYAAILHAFDSTRIQNNCLRRWFGDLLLSTSVKFPKKLLPDTCAYQEVRSVSVSDNFAYVLNGGPFVEFSYHIEATHDQSKTPYKLEIAYLNQN